MPENFIDLFLIVENFLHLLENVLKFGCQNSSTDSRRAIKHSHVAADVLHKCAHLTHIYTPSLSFFFSSFYCLNKMGKGKSGTKLKIYLHLGFKSGAKKFPQEQNVVCKHWNCIFNHRLLQMCTWNRCQETFFYFFFLQISILATWYGCRYVISEDELAVRTSTFPWKVCWYSCDVHKVNIGLCHSALYRTYLYS